MEQKNLNRQDTETEAFLRNLAKETVEKCTFQKQCGYLGVQKMRRVFLPSGDEKYRSFWLIDAILVSDCGFMDAALLKECIEIIFSCGQNGEQTVFLENGLSIPPYAIADHINYDGKAVYFPGTLESGTDQGTGQFGYVPPLNNSYLIANLVDNYIKQSGDEAILYQTYNGLSVKQRLEKAFHTSYGVDPETQLCYGEEEKFVIDWTYCDTIRKSGLFLCPSILRANAAKILGRLFPEEKDHYDGIYEKIRKNISAYFFDESSGWLYSTTGLCHQHDVWGSALAVYSRILDKEVEEKVCAAIRKAYLEGTATQNGYVRHILTTENASIDSAWQTGERLGYYMNGGYWATPSGWFYYALYQVDREAAGAFLDAFICHTKANRAEGAPYEWCNADIGAIDGKNYGTSGTMLYIGYKKANASADAAG